MLQMAADHGWSMHVVSVVRYRFAPALGNSFATPDHPTDRRSSRSRRLVALSSSVAEALRSAETQECSKWARRTSEIAWGFVYVQVSQAGRAEIVWGHFSDVAEACLSGYIPGAFSTTWSFCGCVPGSGTPPFSSTHRRVSCDIVSLVTSSASPSQCPHPHSSHSMRSCSHSTLARTRRHMRRRAVQPRPLRYYQVWRRCSERSVQRAC